MTLVAEVAGESSGVEVGPPRAVLVARPAVGPLRPAQLIESGQGAEGGELQGGAEEVVRVRRAAGNGHHRLAGEDLRRADGARGVGVGRRDPAPGGAGADGDCAI